MTRTTAKSTGGGPRRLFNLQLFDKGGAFWEGTDITEEGDNYICITPRVRNTREQGYFEGLGKKWPQHIWWRFRQAGRVNPVELQNAAFNNDRPGGFYMLPAIACPGSRTVTQHLRFFTPIDGKHPHVLLRHETHEEQLAGAAVLLGLLPPVVHLLQRSPVHQ